MKHKPNEYKAIAAWGEMLRSQSWYIRAEQEKAADDGAPLDAIYKRNDWNTLREVQNVETRNYFVNYYPELVPAEWGIDNGKQ